MPESINSRKVFTLPEVMKSIQRTLNDRYQSTFWVRAEMNKLNYYSHSGHCYPELVEKSEGRVVAQVKSMLWRDDYLNINRNFLKTLKEPLKEGIKILFLAKITFDAVHGLSLQILDIDPAYTLGDLEREKSETLEKLKLEGIFNLNKKALLPMLPQRIAIISVETSKGYADFLKVIDENPWHYKFFHVLFPSVLQGEKAVTGIIGQLRNIEKVRQHFDVVAIVRGGGGDVGLSCYNHYDLARAIATFPLPVITGIGHATNETVAEMISYQNAITPTKIGEFLLQKFHDFAFPVERAKEFIADRARRLVTDEKNRLQGEVKLFKSVTGNIVLKNKNGISQASSTLLRQSQYIIRSSRDLVDSSKNRMVQTSLSAVARNMATLAQAKEKLAFRTEIHLRQNLSEIVNFERHVAHLDPANVLRRGFSITRLNGKAVKDIAEIEAGQTLQTQIYNGTINSTVQDAPEHGRN